MKELMTLESILEKFKFVEGDKPDALLISEEPGLWFK